MSEDSDNNEAPKHVMDEEAAEEPDAAKKEEQETGEAKKGEEKMLMPPPAKNVSGSDAIKAAVKAGNINIHQEERERNHCLCGHSSFFFSVASSRSDAAEQSCLGRALSPPVGLIPRSSTRSQTQDNSCRQ